MSLNELESLFEKHDAEFLKFERIENPLHPCRDICAFLKLHELVPSTDCMISASEHDEFYLGVGPEMLAGVATEADIVYLQRCGVRYDTSTDSLAMFS